MARRQSTDLSAWASLSLEGNLIAAAMISLIDQRKAPEQEPADYAVRKGLTIREEIATAFRVGQSHYDAFAAREHPSADATRRFVRAFFKETFGFDDLADGEGAVSDLAGGRVPIVVVPPSELLDRRSPTLSTDRSRSPAFALQDYLNDKEEALWGLVTNGLMLRLMRDNASLTRPAYIEADLAQIFSNEDIASFAVLWLLIHRSRFGAEGAPATDCALERWRDAGSREGEAARDRLAGQVQEALRLLGSGFLEANPDLANKLQSGEVDRTEWFNELLRLVYRLIFLMVAEDRNLLHPGNAEAEARKLYSEGYSLTALRKQCFRAASWDRHQDRYEGLKIVFRALAHGEDRLSLPALGGLFAEDQLPHLEIARLRNRAFMEALYKLSWLSDRTGMLPVNWRAMETEELGSVYESLLELQPQLGDDGKTLVFASDAAEQKGNQRKTTGSYYTPDSLVQALLDTALDPVLDRTEAEAEDPEKALLELSVIDPACGSGHFLLAAARRIATRLARIRAEGTPSLADFRHALRDVARSCIHGVDRNPMAVELTKVALWIETIDPGLPLGFFDAQIRCGNALLGVFDLKVLEEGIPDAAYKPLTGDDKAVARFYQQANRTAKTGQGGFDFGTGQGVLPAARPMAVEFDGFRHMPEDTLDQIDDKAKRFKALRKSRDHRRLSVAANLYVSAFLLPKKGEVPSGLSERVVPTTEEVWRVLSEGKLRQGITDAPKAARRARAFHWPLEFPDVMQHGGFDVVLGNPPWERIKLQEQEFFASRSPEIAGAANKAARDRLIKVLEKAAPGSVDRALFDAFTEAKREAEATSEFVRVPGEDGGRFSLTGRGDVNTYALFAELFTDLTRQRGGVIVPTGIATDATTAPFFSKLISSKQLSHLISFENEAFIFPSVHHSFKFCLLTISKSKIEKPVFSFFLRNVGAFEDTRRVFTLTASEMRKMNPNTLTATVFRSEADAELTSKIYANVPVLIDESGSPEVNPWSLQFVTLFHMSSDSNLFMTAEQLSQLGATKFGNWWKVNKRNQEKAFAPLYEPKMFSIFDHRASGYDSRGDDRGFRVLPPTDASQYSDPNYDPDTFYWIDETEIQRRMSQREWTFKWLMGWRDVTSPSTERSMLPTIIPFAGVGHKMPLFLPKAEARLCGAFYANMAALVFDFVARQKIGGTSFTYFYLKQLPALPPHFYTAPRLAFITPKVLELTYTSHSLAPFARDLGYDGPPFAWDGSRRALLRADLDAFYVRAYGLSRDELRYILDPTDVKGLDYPSETFRVLKEKETRTHGEYRTRRLVLEAWDRMEANGEFAQMEM